MSSKYYFTLIDENQLEVSEHMFYGGEWTDVGVFYTSAKVTDVEKAWEVLKPVLEREIRDGAVLNCYLGLAGVCPSWAPDEESRIWVQYNGFRTIMVLKNRQEWEDTIASWTSHRDLNHQVTAPAKVLDLIPTKVYPNSAEALVAVANAIASMLI